MNDFQAKFKHLSSSVVLMTPSPVRSQLGSSRLRISKMALALATEIYFTCLLLSSLVSRSVLSWPANVLSENEEIELSLI